MDESTLTVAGAEALRRRAAAASAVEAKASMVLCRYLYETYYSSVLVNGGLLELHELFGYESWNDYVETELDLHQQVAHKNRRVYEVFEVDLEGAYTETLPGITKLRILSRAKLTPKNVDSWLRRAQAATCCKLEHMVSGHNHEIRTLSVTLSGNEKATIETVLIRAKRHYGVASRGTALAKLVRDWTPRQKARKAS